MSAGCLSKQELGGVLRWPLRARTSQSPSAKQQQTRQLTVGPQAVTALLGLPWKLTDSPHLSSSLLSCTIHKGKTVKSWETGSGEKAGAAAVALPIWSVWNVAMLYCMWTDMFVMSDKTTGLMGGFSQQRLDPDLRTGILLFTLWRVPCMIHIVHAKYNAYVHDSFRWCIIMHMSTFSHKRPVPV